MSEKKAEISDFIELENSGSELQTWHANNKFVLVGTVDFTLKNNPMQGYCVDYHYNGQGTLGEEKSWKLDHINVHPNQGNAMEYQISQQELDKKLESYGVRLWDVFHSLLIKRLEDDYPK